MTKHLLTLVLFLPTFIFAQEVKKIKSHPKNSLCEVYYVLKSDNETKHGNYQVFWHDGSVKINGYYKNGIKDSVWTEFYYGTHGIKSIGNYKDGLKDSLWKEYYYDGDNAKIMGYYTLGVKSGIWAFYSKDGDLDQEYDFTQNELVLNKVKKKTKKIEYKVINGTDTTLAILDREPSYIGGQTALYEAVSPKIMYPPLARENGVRGIVFIAFTIDKYGKTSDHRVIKGIGSGCDEEALRVIKLLPDNWIPAQLNGQPVSVEFVCPIGFKLQ